MSKISHYSKEGLWSLFLMCAFPIHVWAILMIFNDVSWVARRTNAWDAVGVASYGLAFAFIESLLFFIIIALLGFLVSTKWDRNRRLTLMSALAFLLSIWAMLSQTYFLKNAAFSVGWLLPLARTAHPLRYFYAGMFGVILLTTLIPVFFILRSERAVRFMMEAIDRLSLLTSFYLFFDLVSLIIIIVRNFN